MDALYDEAVKNGGLTADAAQRAALPELERIRAALTQPVKRSFLRKAPPGPVVGQCRLLKLGSRLAVTDCDITSGGSDDLIAQASATYSLPPKHHHG